MVGLLFFFSALGAFNGILLSAYLFFANKGKDLSKLLLGALVLALSIRIGKSVLLYFDRGLPKIYLQIGLSACLFIGPLLYFYLKSVLKTITILPKNLKWELLCLLAFIVITGTIRPYQVYPNFWNGYLIKVIYGTCFAGVIATGYTLLSIFKKSISKKTNLLPTEKWLLAIYLANLIIAGAFFLAFFLTPYIKNQLKG